MLTLSILLVYFGFYLFIVFLSLCIACGMYYLAELIEEYTLTTKKAISTTIKLELVVHLLLLIDRLPLHCLGLGLASHLAYLRLLRKFPWIKASSPDSVFAAAGFLASTAAWVHHYWHSHYTVEYILAFLVVTTWMVPFAVFLSMAGDQSVLPGAGSGFGYGLSPSSSGLAAGPSGIEWQSGKKRRRGLALRIFDMLRRKRDEVLPDVMSKMPSSSGLMMKEKI